MDNNGQSLEWTEHRASNAEWIPSSIGMLVQRDLNTNLHDII